MNKLRSFLLARLAERSTVVGLVGAGATLAGIAVAPAKMDAIATFVTFAMAMAAVAVPDKKAA